MSSANHSDLLVVGSGIVGLGHAVEAVRRGLTVTLVEREDRVVGASVRNFGHSCATAQAGVALDLARASRERWLELGRHAGFWVGTTGTVVVARADDELVLLREFADARPGEACLLDAAETAARAGSGATDVVGGAFLDRDLRVDPRTAAPAIARWLAAQPGVTFRWSTNVQGVEPGRVRTSRGDLTADQVVVCLGHDVDRLFPDLAEAAGVRRCRLHMLRVEAPGGRTITPAVLTGLSMLRYSGLADQSSAAPVRARFAEQHPELLDLHVNLMLTQRPDGDLLIGDTHEYVASVDPFSDERVDELLLDQTAALLGVSHLRVKERWMGVYASAREEFLVAQPYAGTTVVSVTSGIGMTTGLGLSAHVLGQLVEGAVPTVPAPHLVPHPVP
ncbi:TIGR03364 family FAD-dependent oxidoreductase [Nocardioides sp. InS609-2]|uniref:TIGR03364 family FAD-dependent oxidoreductase n=1 Tax=Nocardioides sp. InS609-2 TaxID=2760705 RepID=UPI0020BECCA4|nr:TIGR03364 family FAD-dependent oxidoreductase [Nocardioides sp. InS609-2]